MKPTLFSVFLLAVAAIAVSGCSGTSPAPTGGGVTTTPKTHDHGTTGSGMEKMKAELAKLSPEDAASAEKQHLCPVSGGMLGTMGAPIKIDVNGETVWICCSGCKQKLLDHPDEYLAKLHNE
ncbi:MAG: hypothetical protein KDA90_05200 [Planctomycetaceae bacterium]|nr:hypothetical protein [Planctomycetaceae bacterium]